MLTSNKTITYTNPTLVSIGTFTGFYSLLLYKNKILNFDCGSCLNNTLLSTVANIVRIGL